MNQDNNPDSEGTKPDGLPARTHGRRRLLIAGAGTLLLGLATFVIVWFQPHTLFIDKRVDDDIPTVEATAGPSPAEATSDGEGSESEDKTTTTVPQVVDLATGTFISLDHSTSGTVRIIELADGSRHVRLEDLETDNGPDLYVWLSTSTADASSGSFRDDYVNLGSLQGNLGNQNYDLPAGVDHTEYMSVVIYCDRFSSPFGAADLAPAT